MDGGWKKGMGMSRRCVVVSLLVGLCVCFSSSLVYFRGTQPDFRSVRSESGRLSG